LPPHSNFTVALGGPFESRVAHLHITVAVGVPSKAEYLGYALEWLLGTPLKSEYLYTLQWVLRNLLKAEYLDITVAVGVHFEKQIAYDLPRSIRSRLYYMSA